MQEGEFLEGDFVEETLSLSLSSFWQGVILFIVAFDYYSSLFLLHVYFFLWISLLITILALLIVVVCLLQEGRTGQFFGTR